MKKIISSILFVLLTLSVVAQREIGKVKVDTIIVTPILKSYFSYSAHNPLFVVYKLYHGGGKESRIGMTFKTDGLKNSQNSSNYSHSGYDIGHMANAEDFANNKEKLEMTFRFYNALPQTPRCNRGIWKDIENKVRKQSQKDTLLIICGGGEFRIETFTYKIKSDKEGQDSIVKPASIIIPDFTFKIIKNLRTKDIKCYVFPNDNSNKMEEEPDAFMFLSNFTYGPIIAKLLK